VTRDSHAGLRGPGLPWARLNADTWQAKDDAYVATVRRVQTLPLELWCAEVRWKLPNERWERLDEDSADAAMIAATVHVAEREELWRLAAEYDPWGGVRPDIYAATLLRVRRAERMLADAQARVRTLEEFQSLALAVKRADAERIRLEDEMLAQGCPAPDAERTEAEKRYSAAGVAQIRAQEAYDAVADALLRDPAAWVPSADERAAERESALVGERDHYGARAQSLESILREVLPIAERAPHATDCKGTGKCCTCGREVVILNASLEIEPEDGRDGDEHGP
jgi:hypothetical protein